MARKRRVEVDDGQGDLNLAPIMNMVMILIPLLLLMVKFTEISIINVNAPARGQSARQADDEPDEEEVQVPRVVVSISSDGFRLLDMQQLPAFEEFVRPVTGCPGAGSTGGTAVVNPHTATATIPPTICLRQGTEGMPLSERLDYAGLYNHLVRIRMKPEWFDAFGEENNSIISILPDFEIPFATIVETMDASRFFLKPANSDLPPPTAASAPESYMLAGGNGATVEDLKNAHYVVTEGDTPTQVDLFPDPVLLLPNAGSGG